jgi:hypothetical protein
MCQGLAGCMDEAPSLLTHGSGEVGADPWADRLHQLELFGCLAQQLPHAAAELQHLAAVAAVLERVPVTGRRSAAGGAAVHPAAVLTRYRRRPARAVAAGPGTASQAQVHGPGLAVHGVDPRFPSGPRPPG